MEIIARIRAVTLRATVGKVYEHIISDRTDSHPHRDSTLAPALNIRISDSPGLKFGTNKYFGMRIATITEQR